MNTKCRLAISVRQPFAEMIMSGKKKIEYRSIPTRVRQRVYIYAAKKKRLDICEDEGIDPEGLVTGVIVGTVEIVDCTGESGDYEWKLARPQRAKRRLKPKNKPQPVWFRPFR
jgi:hypothetical protein